MLTLAVWCLVVAKVADVVLRIFHTHNQSREIRRMITIQERGLSEFENSVNIRPVFGPIVGN